jgi:hypothetical protein
MGTIAELVETSCISFFFGLLLLCTALVVRAGSRLGGEEERFEKRKTTERNGDEKVLEISEKYSFAVFFFSSMSFPKVSGILLSLLLSFLCSLLLQFSFPVLQLSDEAIIGANPAAF